MAQSNDDSSTAIAIVVGVGLLFLLLLLLGGAALFMVAPVAPPGTSAGPAPVRSVSGSSAVGLATTSPEVAPATAGD